MNLNVQAVEKKQETEVVNTWSAPKEVASVETTEQAKIVHNLYGDEVANTITSDNINEKVEEDDAPTFEFESPENTKEEVIATPPTFTPTFVSQESVNVPAEPQAPSSTFADELDSEERMKRSQDRLNQLNNLSKKMKTPSGINDLENEPAYLRRSVKLDSVNHSSETNVSRFTLGDDGENNPEIRSNNSFLHDNVD
jgi:cell division protein FtsZ